MKRMLALAALAATGLLSTSAFALDVTVQNGLVAAPAASTSAASSSSAAAGANISTVVSAIPTTDAKVSNIKSLTSTAMVEVVKLAPADASQSAFVAARSSHAADITKLQTAIDANASLKDALQAKSININNVVAANMMPNGTLVLYATG